MTFRPPVVRRAPGKLFVLGEYAVVEPGTPAILVAVDREVTVTVSDPTDPTGPTGPAGAAASARPARPAAGPAGLTGPAGPGGPEDVTGRTGPVGPSGSTAPEGAAGPEDRTGPAGPADRASSAGPADRTGPAGPAGPASPAGPAGPAGPAVCDGADTVISSDLGPQAPTPHVAAAVQTVRRLLAERGLPAPALRISVTSRLHDNGTKLGLGSSGAVTVAAVAALASFHGLTLTHDHLFRLSLLACARIDALGSGGDLAASTWGGWIAYRAPDRAFVRDLARHRGIDEALHTPWPGLDVHRLPPPAGLTLKVGWSGQPASSTSLLSRLHRHEGHGRAAHRRFVTASADFVRAAAHALHSGDGPGLQQQVRRARTELARLDDRIGLGIFTPELTALCDIAESAGGAAKPSGAGGGDCGIALLDAAAPLQAAHVHARWAAAGVRPLPVRPATQRSEERPP